MSEILQSTIVAPDRSYDQRIEGLRRANAVRTWRAETKRDLKQRTQSPIRLLVDPPAQAQTMKVIDLLIAIPKVGRVKANKMLSRARVSPSKTLGGLSDRQRQELLTAVSALGKRPL